MDCHHEHHHRHHVQPTRDMATITTPGRIIVTNGSKQRLAMPCWYRDRRIGECPPPRVPEPADHSGEMIGSRFPDAHVHVHTHHDMDMFSLVPIPLEDEGYTDVKVNLEKPNCGITATGYIGRKADNEQHVIRIILTAACPDAQLDVLTCKYSVTISSLAKTDVAAVGEIVVLPAILPES